MNPIVNPWLFYLIDIMNGLDVISVVMVALSASYLFTSLAVMVMGNDLKRLDYVKWGNKHFPRALICILFASIISVAIPNESTMYKMLAAHYVTTDNVNAALTMGKDFKDTLKNDIIEVVGGVAVILQDKEEKLNETEENK